MKEWAVAVDGCAVRVCRGDTARQEKKPIFTTASMVVRVPVPSGVKVLVDCYRRERRRGGVAEQ